ncbi:MAG TPA: hypothetical protein VG734_19705 [Lacunisphaera sp.]|nr:hypothetical protein [Lacunisphaera sp.]
MTFPRPILFLFLLVAGMVAAERAWVGVDDSAVIRQRIDALLKRRQKPESLPVDPPNPFALAATGTATVTGTAPAARETPIPGVNPAPGVPAPVPARTEEEAGSANTAELLARVAGRLRITGAIRLKDQLHVIINDSPWKEGDTLVVNQGARIIRLQVTRIQPGQLTLRLEDAELVLKY